MSRLAEKDLPPKRDRAVATVALQKGTIGLPAFLTDCDIGSQPFKMFKMYDWVALVPSAYPHSWPTFLN